jgi:hypothetical protein
MGEAKRRKLAGLSLVLGDIRKLNGEKRQTYIEVARERAKEIAAKTPEGEKLYAAFEPMLRFVVDRRYLGGCHDTSAVLYMRLRQAGLRETDVALCIGEVKVEDESLDHSWVEVYGQVLDVAICAPNMGGGFVGGPVFAGLDLGTNAPSQAIFGFDSRTPLGNNAAAAYGMSLFQYLNFQQTQGLVSMAKLAHVVYGVDGQELLAKYGDVKREWRNPRLNPKEGAIHHPASRG